MQDIAELEQAITRLGAAATAAQFGELVNAVDSMLARAKLLKVQLENAMLEHIQATGQDIIIGPIRYYVGTRKTTKCWDKSRALQMLLEVCAGDVATVANLMASEPFKPGACRQAFEEAGRDADYRACFATAEEPELKEGKPQKTLQHRDTRFIR